MPVKSLLDPATKKMLLEAVASELYASHLYQHLANQMQFVGRFGAAKFFQAESLNERAHFQKLVDYFDDRGDWVAMPAVPKCDDTAKDLPQALQIAYDTELQLERDYVGWYKACLCEITRQFLLSFLEEQRKSVGEFSDLLAEVALAGDDRAALMMLDNKLGA